MCFLGIPVHTIWNNTSIVKRFFFVVVENISFWQWLFWLGFQKLYVCLHVLSLSFFYFKSSNFFKSCTILRYCFWFIKKAHITTWFETLKRIIISISRIISLDIPINMRGRNNRGNLKVNFTFNSVLLKYIMLFMLDHLLLN